MLRRTIVLLLLIAVISPRSMDDDAFAQQPSGSSTAADRPPQRQIEQQLEGPVKAQEIAATSAWISSTGVVDWLGPLAPLALSPFFGVTCLSGLALWGPDWATSSELLRSAGPLQNQVLFFVFLALTVLTSIPRLMKVSKPIAQATDRLETYAVIVILLMIKIFASTESPAIDGGPAEVAAVQLGIISFTLDTLLVVAMVINILVINSVKFFFEFMVWLTPIPFLDAVFEICNKALCALLMLIYAFSPTLATAINLAMLLAAAIMLRWISRRVRFYRTMVLDPLIAQLWTGFGKPKRAELIVFPKSDFGPFKAKSRLRLRRSADTDGGWVCEEANWWMPSRQHAVAATSDPRISLGWVMHAIEVLDVDDQRAVLVFSRRYDTDTLRRLAEELDIQMLDEAESGPQTDISAQFA